MKFLKILIAIIAILVLIFFVGSLFLPKTFSISRSTAIAAPDSVVYKNIADYNEFLKWNPWTKMEPTAKIEMTGTPTQPGHAYTWEGDKTGSGSMKVTQVEPYKLVVSELKFIKPQESLADTKFEIAKEGDSVKVTWTMSGNVEGPMHKWFSALVMQKMLGKSFEEGLQALKEKSEKGL